jgi:hypothetical protein
MIANKKFDFVTFQQGEGGGLFDAYLKIKYDVFIEEMRWSKIPHSKANRMALPDQYDGESTFCGEVDQIDGLVGVVRGTLPKRLADMYRAELYSDFAALDFVRALDGRIATINSLAVRREYRRASFLCGCDRLLGSPPIAVSETLMKNMILELSNMGAEVILLSAIDGPAFSLARRIGFKTISPPHIFLARDYSVDEDVPTLTVFDMAIIIRDFGLGQIAGLKRSNLDDLTASQAINRLRVYLNEVDKIHRVQMRSNQ